MRTLGDMSWINQYIGMPYKFGGRTRQGVDCFGLVKLVYAEQYGEDLPDWATDTLNLKIRNREITGVVQGGDFTEVEEPVEGTFVVCYRTRAAHHLGLHFGGGVLHCTDGIGVVYEPLGRFAANYTKIVFGEWHPCP